jgi:hypothetical protein
MGIAAVPAAADATCYSSTPAGLTWSDSPLDGDAGLAPEILGVTANLDASCRLAVQDVIAGAPSPGGLVDGDAVGIYLNTDGNPATGSPLWNGADRAVIIVGATGPDLPPGLGTWNGVDFTFGPWLAPYGGGGFSATLDELGVAAPATLGIRTGAIWSDGVTVYGDLAPEVGQPSFAFPAAFSTTPPPPSPPPPAPTPTPQPAAAPAASQPTPQLAPTKKRCRVPNVRSLTLARARARLRHAGCRYRISYVRRGAKPGRVSSTYPRPGTRTRATVVVRVVRARTRATAAAASTMSYAALEDALSSARRQASSAAHGGS